MEQVRLVDQISARLSAVRRRVGEALRRAGREEGAVTIVAVTKKFGPPTVRAALVAGLTDFGENRIQEAKEKVPAVVASSGPLSARWHLIGHLQRNKARRAAELFDVVHSVDSLRLAQTLAAAREAALPPLAIFLQVNVAGEAQKSGVTPEEIHGLWRGVLSLPALSCHGLMTMAPFSDDPEEARPHFRALRQIRDDLAASGNGPPPTALSMGMSGDYEVAIEEGATHVRIGTALFGSRETGTPDGRSAR